MTDATDDHGPVPEGERVTAPMQSYTSRDVGVGVAVFAAGLLVAFGVPLALTAA